MRLFKQRFARLANGTKVKEGDTVTFKNSDGILCTSKIMRRHDKTLYFFNICADIKDYRNAEKII